MSTEELYQEYKAMKKRHKDEFDKLFIYDESVTVRQIFLLHLRELHDEKGKILIFLILGCILMWLKASI